MKNSTKNNLIDSLISKASGTDLHSTQGNIGTCFCNSELYLEHLRRSFKPLTIFA